MSLSSSCLPRVRVLLAAYNGERWIGRQIDSVLAQRGVEVEILVSDDGSADGTVDVVSRLAMSEPRVRLLPRRPPVPSTTGGGSGGNFLYLLSQDAGPEIDYLAFCDQDDVWYDTKLMVACHVLATRRADLYSGATSAVWADGKRRTLGQSLRRTVADFLFEGVGQGCTFVGTARLFGEVRELLRRHPEISRGVHYHDWLVYALARTWSRKWIFDPTPQMDYAQHGANDTGARSSSGGVRRRLSLIRSGWYRAQVQAIIHACLVADARARDVLLVQRLMQRAESSWWDRARWCSFLLRHSRRRLVDRLILTSAAAFGYI